MNRKTPKMKRTTITAMNRIPRLGEPPPHLLVETHNAIISYGVSSPGGVRCGVRGSEVQGEFSHTRWHVYRMKKKKEKKRRNEKRSGFFLAPSSSSYHHHYSCHPG